MVLLLIFTAAVAAVLAGLAGGALLVLWPRYQRLQREVRERRNVEEALAGERNLLRTLMDNLPDYILVNHHSVPD